MKNCYQFFLFTVSLSAQSYVGNILKNSNFDCVTDSCQNVWSDTEVQVEMLIELLKKRRYHVRFPKEVSILLEVMD